MPYHTIDSMNWRPKDDAVIPRWVMIKNCACGNVLGQVHANPQIQQIQVAGLIYWKTTNSYACHNLLNLELTNFMDKDFSSTWLKTKKKKQKQKTKTKTKNKKQTLISKPVTFIVKVSTLLHPPLHMLNACHYELSFIVFTKKHLITFLCV